MSSRNRKSRKRIRSTASSGSIGSDTRSLSSERTYTSQLCNLIFPVPRVKQMLKFNNYASRVSDKSAVFLTTVMEYAIMEILEASINAAREEGGSRIHPRHINFAIKTDPEFLINFRNTSMKMGGTIRRPGEEETRANGSRPKNGIQPKRPRSKPATTKPVANQTNKKMNLRPKKSR